MVFYCRYNKIDCLVQGVIKNEYGYYGNVYKDMSSNVSSNILERIMNDIYCNNIFPKYKIEYPKEEKYGVLVIKGEYEFDLKTVWAKKKTLLKYGEAVFETSMQEWLNYGDTYFYSYENIIELIGTVFKPIHIGDNLMLINDLTENELSVFSVEKIYYRGNYIEEVFPYMRCCKIILRGDHVHISERSLFVKI